MIDMHAIFTQYEPQFTSLNARIYAAHPHEDILILRWWLALSESREIELLITPDSRRLPAFYRLFTPPTALLYALSDDGEISQAAWLTPVDQTSTYSAAYSGLWCSPLARGTHRHLSFTTLTYSLAFEFYSAIIGTTWQPNLLDVHLKLGYAIVGCIPNIYDQPQVYIVHLTKEAFQQSRFAQITQRRQ